MSNTKQRIQNLYKAIQKIDGNKHPRLKNWNQNYFTEHKNRYPDDLRIIQQIYTKGKIVEIGSLPCHMTFLLKKLNLPAIGIDINPTRCQPFIDEHQLNILQCDIEKDRLPFENNSISLIIFNETFEHLRINPLKTLRELNRVLSKDGKLLLATPNLYSLRNILSFNLGRSINDPIEAYEKLDLIGHMGHIKEYSPKEMTKLLSHTGFKVIQHKFKWYNKSVFASLLYSIFRKNRPVQILICKK